MPPAGRLGDQAQVPADAHGCPGCPHPAIGPAVSGSGDVNINGRPALRVGDRGMHAACCGSNTWEAVKGAPGVFINGKPAHRLGDAVQHCGGAGKLVEGSGNVDIGDFASTSGATAVDAKARKKRNWIRYELRIAGAPIKAARYELTLNTGEKRQGKTAAQGVIHEEDFDAVGATILKLTI